MSRHRTGKRQLFALVASLSIILAACSPPPAAPTPIPTAAPTPTDTPVPEGVLSPKDLAAFDFVIEKKIEAVPLAGLTLAIHWGDNPLYVKGYGYADLAASAPAAKDTVYQIASLTKQFTAAAIMQLVQEGQITLDDPVSKFFPQAPDSWQRVTVHHLLNHTAGLPDITELSPGEVKAGLAHPNSGDEIIAGLQSAPLWFEPGSQFRYGGTGYRLLAAIIEQVTGLRSEEYFEQHFFEPLGLESTFACEGRYEEIAQGYLLASGRLEPVLAYNPSRIVGSSGLCSTSGDLIAWQQALASGEVISAELYETMTRPTLLADGTTVPYGYALGLGEGIVAHGGSLPGFRSWMIVYPEDDLTLVILSNTDIPAGYSLDALAEVIAGRILEGAGEKGD